MLWGGHNTKQPLILVLTLVQVPQESDHNGSEKTESKSERAEKKAQIKELGESAEELSEGKLNEKAQAKKQEQYRSGKSGVSGLWESDGAGGLPKAKDLFGDQAHGPLTKADEKTLDEMKEKSREGMMLGAGGKFVAESVDNKQSSVRVLSPQESSKPYKDAALYPDGPPPIPAKSGKDSDDPVILAQAEFWRYQASESEKANAANIAVGELHAFTNVAAQTIIGFGDLTRMAVASGPVGRFAPDLDPGAKKMLDDAFADWRCFLSWQIIR